MTPTWICWLIYDELLTSSERADFSGINGKRDLRLHTFAQINRFAVAQVIKMIDMQ